MGVAPQLSTLTTVLSSVAVFLALQRFSAVSPTQQALSVRRPPRQAMTGWLADRSTHAWVLPVCLSAGWLVGVVC